MKTEEQLFFSSGLFRDFFEREEKNGEREWKKK